MDLRIYNTLSRRQDVFEPLDPDHVRMYVCGPTVYDYAHIGNARPVVVFDVLYRLLGRLYPRVTYVRNITDVDDKIIDAAARNGEAIGDLTKRTEDIFHADMGALNALDPDVEPRATETIPEMVAMIGALIDKGHAYAADGHVLFAVASMEDYGALSNRSRDEQIAGARVEVAPYKRDPADFVLWKPSTGDQPGWDSPWGFGRPGWHMECSAMSKKFLGTSFDIHGGGQDLIFPHHENERAQSQCAHDGQTFVRYWMHNGYLMVEGEKMSKSLGNFLTVHDLLDSHPGEVLRLTLLATHYRQPLNWTADGVARSRDTLDRFYTALGDATVTAGEPPAGVLDALKDDLNTPLAVSRLHELASVINKNTNAAETAQLRGQLLAGGRLLGLLMSSPGDWFRGDAADGPSAEEIEALIAQRNQARKDRDFTTADRIRDQLAGQGVVLEDGPQGTGWKRQG